MSVHVIFFRLSKDATLALCQQIRPYVQPTVRSTAIPFELKVQLDKEIFYTHTTKCLQSGHKTS